MNKAPIPIPKHASITPLPISSPLIVDGLYVLPSAGIAIVAGYMKMLYAPKATKTLARKTRMVLRKSN